MIHDISGRSCCVPGDIEIEHVDISGIHNQIDKRDAGNSESESPRQVSALIADFGCNERGVGPAAECIQHEDQR